MLYLCGVRKVVICFQISIFELQKTAAVSFAESYICCDLLSN